MARRKNSLVANINRRRRAGKTRPKSAKTVSREAYREMQHGWPHPKTARGKKAATKTARKTASKKKATRKKTTGKGRARAKRS